MTDPDQCIICLEALPPLRSPDGTEASGGAGAGPPQTTNTKDAEPEDATSDSTPNGETTTVATLNGCGHMLHDVCIRSWAEKTNTCPICRTAFQKVKVLSSPDGVEICTYHFEDKKQVAEFDLREWLEQNPEEEVVDDEPEFSPCPICERSDHEEVLLICDGCEVCYHTYCVDLSDVPEGSWYCFECVDCIEGPTATSIPSASRAAEVGEARPPAASRRSGRRSGFPRTRDRVRRARRQARSIAWEGAWGQIAGRVFDAINLDLDLDYHEDDDDALENFRRSQRQRAREHQEYQRWQQRLNIADRLGAREVFANNIPRAIGQQLRAQPSEPPQQTRDERLAWGALDRIRESEDDSANAAGSSSRKRKSRSVTASPVEPTPQEPVRQLKRPRTRRLPLHGEASTSASSPAQSSRIDGGSSSAARSPGPPLVQPSFLSSLLKEVEMSTPSDDEAVRSYFVMNGAADAPSPVTSPSPSSHNSPRALSITPPPIPSPPPLSSYVEPRFPRANYSPNRSSPDRSDTERRTKTAGVTSPEIRQPRPQRPLTQRPAALARSPDSSPTRSNLPLETKQSISGIVRSALKPHWRANELTSEQYEHINRDVSRKLYDEVRDPSTVGDDAKRAWEKIASQEVSRALQELKT